MIRLTTVAMALLVLPGTLAKAQDLDEALAWLGVSAGC